MATASITLFIHPYKFDEKSNKITAIPQLLNCAWNWVTIDAMGCQKDIAEEIVSLEADYL